MLICLDLRTGAGCRTKNPDGILNCQQCNLSLRYALILHNPGTIITNYRILQVLGYGGFGAVYEAEDQQQKGLRVALKETFDPSSIYGFQSEFDVLSRLQHPNLPHYYRMFEAQGNGYLVMELVPGQSLVDVLNKQQGPLFEGPVLGYAWQLCDVLSYLHNQTPIILHRDIKPANIRLTPEGLIKLVDFGLLKQGTAFTIASQKLLTPAYAPLEQWSGGTDPRSDIYSLGATLYHLLTNEEPVVAIYRNGVSPDPLLLPQQINRNLTPQIGNAVMTAMAVLQKDRYQSITAFRQALTGNNQPAFINSAGITTIPALSTQRTLGTVHQPSYVKNHPTARPSSNAPFIRRGGGKQHALLGIGVIILALWIATTFFATFGNSGSSQQQPFEQTMTKEELERLSNHKKATQTIQRTESYVFSLIVAVEPFPGWKSDGERLKILPRRAKLIEGTKVDTYSELHEVIVMLRDDGGRSNLRSLVNEYVASRIIDVQLSSVSDAEKSSLSKQLEEDKKLLLTWVDRYIQGNWSFTDSADFARRLDNAMR